MTIHIGDQVSWRTRSTTRPYLHTVTGRVVSVNDTHATIEHDDRRLSIMALDNLTRVGAIEAVAEDYDFAVRQCGSLGGVELY